MEGHGALRLTADSGAVLKGEREVRLREDPARPVRRVHAARSATGTPLPDLALPAEASTRFEALRAWRSAAARAQNVPAYVIFHDRTLREIALAAPRGLEIGRANV